MFNKIRRKLFVLIIFILFVSPLLSGCTSQEEIQGTKPITLNYWRVWDGPDVFDEIIASYKKLHPNISINYKKLRYDEYEKELIEGFATDSGPDIFSVHNTWMNKYKMQGLIEPMPNEIVMVFPVVKGKVKKEVFYEKRSKKYSVGKLQNDFVDVVYDDVVMNEVDELSGNSVPRIYGLPLAIDTLSLFYNRDLFNNAGITLPPEYWNVKFQQDVKKLTKQNSKGELIQSGIGLGGGENIERSSDILSALMMQNGATMMNGKSVTFNQEPGLEALRFYTDFANPGKEVYCWNKSLDNSLDLFVQGKLAMMFGYSYMLPDIKTRAPKMNLAISKLPQIEDNANTVNFANYWVETVSSKTEHKMEAWDFIKYISEAEQAKKYSEKTKKASALRSLIMEQLDDDEIGVFANQVLTAKSWYRGYDANSAEKIIKEMIEEVVESPDEEIANIINVGAERVQQTITKR